MLQLRFDDGTLVLEGPIGVIDAVAPEAVRDARIAAWRLPALAYADLLRRCHAVRQPYEDRARAYSELQLHEAEPLPLRPYQQEALASWEAGRRRGVIVLPTGAGKSYVALRAILACQRSALVLAPTIDLVQQWAGDLERRLGTLVGQYGGGERRLAEVTVATYDSGVLLMPHHGHRFGLLICDECHHLPAPATRLCAEAAIAPFRLGLTATPERSDGSHGDLDQLLGPLVHRCEITELEGRFLANYQVELLEVGMDADEAGEYASSRQQYRDFVSRRGINLKAADGWQQFLAACARDREGRAAHAAWRRQRFLAKASRAKLRVLWNLLREHPGERCIVFTDDNDTAYTVGAQMLLPVLTHRTRPAERKAFLAAFRNGSLPVLVTSRVLNEGVDVPEATVGVVMSGSGTVREHVQRLGRILRPKGGKVAILYELVSAGTAEAFTSQRRRNHSAFGQEQVGFEG